MEVTKKIFTVANRTFYDGYNFSSRNQLNIQTSIEEIFINSINTDELNSENI